MRLRYPKTLITGPPGVGKTTLVHKILNQLEPVQAAGFYTSEVISNGRRVGFELRGLGGERRILAHTSIGGPYRVGKYGVDTEGLDEFLSGLNIQASTTKLIVIDEIGKMELFSRKFRDLVRDILNSDIQMLATVAMKGGGLIRETKQRPDVHLCEVNRHNRDRLRSFILQTP